MHVAPSTNQTKGKVTTIKQTKKIQNAIKTKQRNYHQNAIIDTNDSLV